MPPALELHRISFALESIDSNSYLEKRGQPKAWRNL